MAEIKIRELSIGDWVMFSPNKKISVAEPLFTSAPAKITSAYCGREVSLEIECNREFMAIPLSCIEPIPLTPKILEKNGFVKNGEYNEWNIGTWRTPYLLGVSLERPAITIKWNGSSIFIDQAKYVHQLQHALRLAGVEKEIEV